MWLSCVWDDGPTGNVRHIADNGFSVEEVEYVLENSTSQDISRASGLPCVFGYTPDGEYIMVVYRELDEFTIRVSTAYVVPEPGI